MQAPSRLLLDGWSGCIKLCPEISELLSSDAMLESSYVSEIQTISNILTAI